MGIDQTRRITFEEAADFYNETRPEYPDEVVEDGMRLSAFNADRRILEIGCEAVVKNTNYDNSGNLYLASSCPRNGWSRVRV